MGDVMEAGAASELQAGQRPRVSVVIPCFNSAPTILPCLESVFGQEYPQERVEVLLCDNGSTDSGPELAQERFPAVRVLRTEEKGSGHARNLGFFAATGELILSTDADCVTEPGWMGALVKAMTAAPESTAAIGGVILPYSQQTMVERYERSWVRQAEEDAPRQARFVATPNGCFRPEAVRRVGGFDGGAGHDDSDLGLRLQLAGYSIGYTRDAVVRHRNPAAFRELYEHRRKYGERNFILACKHPGELGSPEGAGKRRRLLRETIGRVLKNVVKLPLSLVYRPQQRSIGWPAVDMVIAIANYRGFVEASRRYDVRQAAVSPPTKV